MWAADGNVNWLARCAGATLGSASGWRRSYQASSDAATIANLAVKIEDGIDLLGFNSHIHPLSN